MGVLYIHTKRRRRTEQLSGSGCQVTIHSGGSGYWLRGKRVCLVKCVCVSCLYALLLGQTGEEGGGDAYVGSW